MKYERIAIILCLYLTISCVHMMPFRFTDRFENLDNSDKYLLIMNQSSRQYEGFSRWYFSVKEYVHEGAKRLRDYFHIQCQRKDCLRGYRKTNPIRDG